MASVPGEYDPKAGLDADEQAAVVALVDPKKPPQKPEQTDDEREDREREAAAKQQAERDAAGADEAQKHAADAEMDDVEERARAMGWVPQSEFKGDPTKWRPAAEWLERGFANPYILKSLNDRLEHTRRAQAQELADVKRRLDESTQVVRAINARFENADRAGYDRAVRELRTKQEEAVFEADTDKFKQASADLEALQRQGPPQVLPAPAPRQDPPTIDPDVAAWADENKWFSTDPELSDYATVVERALQREYKAAGRTEADIGARNHLNELTRRVKERYADHALFTNENPRRAARNSVASPSGERGQNGALNGSNKPRRFQRNYENLPPDAKEACDKQIRVMGMKKDGKTPWFSREQYCATYDWPPEFY